MIKTQAQLLAEVAANITDPQNKQNTAARVREVCNDIIDTMFQGSVLYTVKKTITSAEILNGFSVPVLAIAAPGAGYAIRVNRASARLNFNSVAYGTASNIALITDTANLHQMICSTLITATITQHGNFSTNGITGATDTQILENKALYFKVLQTNASAGNSTLDLYITYELVQL